MPGVRAVAPEVWGLAPSIEGRGMLMNGILSEKGNELDLRPAGDRRARTSSPIRTFTARFSRGRSRRTATGRFLEPERSRAAECRDQPEDRPPASRRPEASPRRLATRFEIGGKPFQIIGIYETGSMILDVVIVMDIETARAVLNEPKDSVSCIYVEGDRPRQQRGALGGDRKGASRLRCAEHERGPGQLQLADGAGRLVLADDRQPGA